METSLISFVHLFDLSYTFVNIVAIYIIIKVATALFPHAAFKKAHKQLTTVVVSVVLAIGFNVWFDTDGQTLLVSAMLSIIAYDFIIKKILTLLKIK